MNKKIHYDANVFFLTAMIHHLNDAIRINVDSDLFADKILEDTLFIHKTVQNLYKSLNENSNLIHKNTYLHLLLKLKRQYNKLLENILNLDDSYASIYRPSFPTLRQIAATSLEDIQDIREELNKMSSGTIDTNVISYDELNILMSPFEENAEISG